MRNALPNAIAHRFLCSAIAKQFEKSILGQFGPKIAIFGPKKKAYLKVRRKLRIYAVNIFPPHFRAALYSPAVRDWKPQKCRDEFWGDSRGLRPKIGPKLHRPQKNPPITQL